MKNIFGYIRARIQRGHSLSAIGPNEGRIIFDLFISTACSIASSTFTYFFVNIAINPIAIVLLPLSLVGLNALAGIYSKHRTSSGRKKAILLFTTSATSAICIAFTTGTQASALLWFMLVFPQLALTRLFLNLQYSKHKNLIIEVARQRGPTLVIGGAGYIGSHVVEQLLKDGQKVRVIDRLMYGRESISEFATHPNFELIEGDATDIATLPRAMKGASTVVHLAGLVGDPACAVDPQFTRHTNIIATKMAKDIAKALGVYRFIFASSCSVYGSSDAEVRESDPLNPVSLYAQTKIDSENELLHSVPDDFFITVLRFATVFGHSRRPRFDLVANLFTAQAFTEGIITVFGPNQWRPFIHVSDLARAILLVSKAETSLIQSQVFNVGDKNLNMTILQLATIVKKVVDEVRPVKITINEDSGDRRNYAVSFDKIHSALRFEAQITIEKGITEILQEFQRTSYNSYKNQLYSNLEMTKRALVEYFRDPIQNQNLYSPRSETTT